MKVAKSITIEHDLVEWLNNKGNASNYINALLYSAYRREQLEAGNAYEKISKAKQLIADQQRIIDFCEQELRIDEEKKQRDLEEKETIIKKDEEKRIRLIEKIKEWVSNPETVDKINWRMNAEKLGTTVDKLKKEVGYNEA